MIRVTIFPEWGGYKIKVDGNTVGAAPAGDLDRAKELAEMQCKNIGEKKYSILNEQKQVVEIINF